MLDLKKHVPYFIIRIVSKREPQNLTTCCDMLQQWATIVDIVGKFSFVMLCYSSCVNMLLFTCLPHCCMASMHLINIRNTYIAIG